MKLHNGTIYGTLYHKNKGSDKLNIPVCFPPMKEEDMHLMIQYLNALKDECKDVSECVRWINFVIADLKIRIKRKDVKR